MQNQVLGKYRIERELARGGMGVISLAYDTLCHRYVALKQIRPEVKKQKGAVKRFLNEARITASLTHPGIISVYDICDAGVDSYYTMPYLQGKSLRQSLLEARAAPQDFCLSTALSIFISVASAIDFAHSKKVVHRDIKADNIWLLAEDEAVILDWGAAKRLDEEKDEEITSSDEDSVLEEKADLSAAETEKIDRKAYQANPHAGPVHRGPCSGNYNHKPSASSVVGTLNYMAPERIFREKASFVTEVYSLGVLLYFMVSLQLPFLRKSFRKCRQSLHLERYTPPHKKALYRSIPWSLVEIINKSLAKEPSERYQNVKELIHEIKQFQEYRSCWRSEKRFSPAREEDWLDKSWQNLPCLFVDEKGKTVDLGKATRMQAPFSLNGQFEVHCQMQSDLDARGVLFHFDPHAPLHDPSNIERLYFKSPIPQSNKQSHWLKRLKEHVLKERTLHENGSQKPPQCEGISIWISGRKEIPGALIRDGVTILSLPSFQLHPGVKHTFRMENKDQVLLFYFDCHPPIRYISPIPLVSMPLTLWVLPGHFSEFSCRALGGQLKLEGSCLDLPDYLFAKGRYFEAIEHYENIRSAFSDYQEGVLATFRCALAWIALAKQEKGQRQERILEQALSCLSSLDRGHSYPLQWLGKSLVYRLQGDFCDEAKALEMAYLRSGDNPLLEKVDEELIFRLQQSAGKSPLFSLQLMLCICRSRRSLLDRIEVRLLFVKGLSSIPPHHIWPEQEEMAQQFLSENQDQAIPQSLILKLTIYFAFHLSCEEVIQSTISQHLQNKETSLCYSELSNLWVQSLLSLQELQAQTQVVSVWNQGRHLAQEKELMIASYQIAYPCGTFWLQNRFALTQQEQRVLCASLGQAFTQRHKKMYLICSDLDHKTRNSERSLSSRSHRSKIVISSHLLFGKKEQALARFFEEYAVLPLDFRAFINALISQEKREFKTAVSYIEGILQLEQGASYYMLWAKIMLLIYPESPKSAVQSLSQQIQEVMDTLTHFQHLEVPVALGRFCTLIEITKLWAPERFACIESLYPVIAQRYQNISTGIQLRVL